MKHIWIYVVFVMVLNFQRIPASDVCFSNEQTSNCNCIDPPPRLPCLSSPGDVNFTEGPASTTSVSANFTGPKSAHCTLPKRAVDRYSISCSRGDASPATIEDTSQTSYMASCVNLTVPGDTYNMTVNSIVDNCATDTSSTTRLVALPSAVNISEGCSNDTAISATWTISNSVVDTFHIMCSNGTASPEYITVDSSPTNENFTASCTELPTPGLEYNLSVVAISNNKRSAVRTVGVHASSAQGVNLTEGSESTTSVSTNWTRPQYAVESYSISCSSGDASPATIEDTSQTSYVASCVDLTVPGDTYTMTVYSILDSCATNTSSSIALVALPEAVTFNEDCDMVNTTTITANWTIPSGKVEYYEVSCSNGTASPARVNPSDDLRTSCTGLSTPGDNYTISVTSVSNGKRSAVSTITITALPEAVTLNEKCDAVNTNTITANWTMPDGIVEYYEVSCSNGTDSPAQVYPSDDLTASCTGLSTPGDNYTISVTSVSNGKRSAASTITITALPESVTLNEDCDMVNTTTITANWTMPNGKVEYYEVSCSNGTASLAQVNPSANLIVSCTGLSTPGDNYTISVTSVSNGKRSAASTITITALPSAVSLSEGCSNNTIISATWIISNSVVDTFNVTCSVGTASPASITVASSPTSDTFTASCTGLPTPGLEYNLSVVAISNNKRSAVRTVGVYASPAGVVNLTKGSASTTSVSANWTRPKCAVESFMYSISCSLGDASPATIEDTSQSFYVAHCVDLTIPGDTYTMTVYISVDSGATNTSSSIILVALPEVVTLIEKSDMVTTTTITASWTNATGEFDYYEVSCSNGTVSTAKVYPSDALIGSCTRLNPGGNYTISVTTFSNSQRSAASTITITTSIDNCDSNPCLNRGTCTTDGVNSYNCTCATGYTGINCSTAIDNCDPNPCLNRGTCTADGVNSYNCECATHYTGTRCECTINDSDHCQKDIDNCNPNPCLNGGTCKDLVNSYSCDCATGYTGMTCSTALVIALTVAFVLSTFFLVAVCFLAFVYHRSRKASSQNGSTKPSRYRQTEPFVHEITSGAKLQRSSSVGHRPSGNTNPLFAHKFKDELEMGCRSDTDEMVLHDAEVQGLSYRRQTVDDNGFSYGHPTTSGSRANESYLNGAPQKELRV